jgi:hypothetical protein
MTKIDELMELANDVYAHKNGAFDALRTALEAALKPGEPVGEGAGYFEKGFDTTKTLYGKIWNQDLPMGAKLYTAPPAQTPPHLHQSLTDPENQPNQFGVEFGLHGEKMFFKVGAQQFTLDYAPDESGDFESMRDSLIHAFSTFTHDVKMTPPPRLTEAVIFDLDPHPHIIATQQVEFARAIEAAVRKQFLGRD